MEGKILKEVDFELTGTTWNGTPYTDTVHTMFLKNNGFQYGNGTTTIILWPDGNVEEFDTRYNMVTAKTFADFAANLIKERIGELFTVKAI